MFINALQAHQWVKVTKETLIFREDFPKRIQHKTRHVPECVLQQLNLHLDKLGQDLSRMMHLIQETGMRVGEAINLKRDCLSTDKDGDYYLTRFEYKMRKEHTVPISNDLAKIILAQQKLVKKEFGNTLDLLFPVRKDRKANCQEPQDDRVGKQWLLETLQNRLNALAKKYKIKDENGEIWWFELHQFRHTVGTRMINNNVPQHIVQKFLGHNSNEINDSDEDIDAKWLKANLYTQSLPNGICALPMVQGHCPHANACLTCVNFRTDGRFLDVHKEQLNKTDHLILECTKKGFTRQVEMNQQVKDNLNKIIVQLEIVDE